MEQIDRGDLTGGRRLYQPDRLWRGIALAVPQQPHVLARNRQRFGELLIGQPLRRHPFIQLQFPLASRFRM